MQGCIAALYMKKRLRQVKRSESRISPYRSKCRGLTPAALVLRRPLKDDPLNDPDEQTAAIASSSL
jgi:hypothetical protein